MAGINSTAKFIINLVVRSKFLCRQKFAHRSTNLCNMKISSIIGWPHFIINLSNIIRDGTRKIDQKSYPYLYLYEMRVRSFFIGSGEIKKAV